MAATRDSFAEAVERLVRKFDADRNTYLSAEYNEAQARLQFINPFFKALGWDVENESGAPYHLCDVWVERGETEGRPDYTFRLDGEIKFFIEAKAPSDDLSHSRNILQAKGYAWNSKTVFYAGLTNFEEFRFFDATLTLSADRAQMGQKIYLYYKEYLTKIDLLWELSRQRVAAGSLDQFLERDRNMTRYRVPVDEAFLAQLTDWRLDLAKSVHKVNPGIDPKALNEIVQRLLDRIVFVRVAEDRRVIEPRQLWDITELWRERGGTEKRPIMDDLVGLFRQINDSFNGEIFKPHPCESIRVETKVLDEIIRGLYSPKSHYMFDVIGVELLGSIYERYLGNTLVISGKKVQLVPKPDVRKAGGVYYTPKFIVDYIVRNTVGKLVEGKKPKEVEKLRIVDPACGSGSFLIGAYQYLIDWHLRYYLEHHREANVQPAFPDLEKDWSGNPRLGFHRKVHILRHNLYGVDVDPQAVEITMMSLYLKALEGEQSMLGAKHEKLPELKFNVRCGNSLIAPDFEKEHALTTEERERIRPFDWNSREAGFGDILAAGGFDTVIGNPPYGADYDPGEKAYFQTRYVYKKGKPETYIFFMERGVSVLRKAGRLGFITPNAWLSNHYGVQIRRYLLENTHLENLVDLEPTKVFEGAVVDTAVTTLSRLGESGGKATTVVWQGTKDRTIQRRFEVNQRTWKSDKECVISLQADPVDRKLLTKLEGSEERLGKLVDYSQGVIPYKTRAEGEANRYVSDSKRGRDWLPLIESAAQIRRYEMDRPRSYIKYGEWLWCRREPKYFSEPKILFHRLRKKLPVQLVGALDESGVVNRHSLSNLILRPRLNRKTLFAVLGLFNSHVANWWFVKRYGVLMEVGGFKVGNLPLPRNWGRAFNRLGDLAEQLTELHVRSRICREARQISEIERQMTKTDQAINDLVYELYGVTDEERKIIEDAAGGAARRRTA